MISYPFVPISSQKRVLFFETPGMSCIQLDNKRREVNSILKEQLTRIGIPYINKDKMKHSQLDRWGLHPNFGGNHLLTRNFIEYLKSQLIEAV